MKISFEDRVLIYRAAHGMIEKGQLEAAISDWETKGAAFTAKGFASHCRSEIGLPESSASQFVAKFQEIKGESPVSAPAARTTTPPPRIPSPVSRVIRKADDQTVFEYLLVQLLEKLENLGAQRLEEVVGAALPSAGLPSTYGQVFANWIKDPSHLQNAEFSSLTQGQMKQVLDSVYTWFCKLVGPVKTDQVFARAVKQAEMIPEAVNYSPRRLL